jgi:hypothetical protein
MKAVVEKAMIPFSQHFHRTAAVSGGSAAARRPFNALRLVSDIPQLGGTLQQCGLHLSVL